MTCANCDRPLHETQLGQKALEVLSRLLPSSRGRAYETEFMEVYQWPDEVVRPSQARRDVSWQERIIHMLDETGVRSECGQHWDLEGVESIVDDNSNGKTLGTLCHTGTLVDRKSGKKAPTVIGIRPEDAKVDVTAIQRNVQQVLKQSQEEVLVGVGAEFAGGTEPGKKGHRWAAVVMRARASPELHLTGVMNKAGTTAMVLVAEPAVKVDPIKGGEFTCTVFEWNEFDPVTGAAHWRKQAAPSIWMLGTDNAGIHFCVRRIQLPRRLRKKTNRQVLEGLLGCDGCPEALNAAFG